MSGQEIVGNRYADYLSREDEVGIGDPVEKEYLGEVVPFAGKTSGQLTQAVAPFDGNDFNRYPLIGSRGELTGNGFRTIDQHAIRCCRGRE